MSSARAIDSKIVVTMKLLRDSVFALGIFVLLFELIKNLYHNQLPKSRLWNKEAGASILFYMDLTGEIQAN